MADEVDLCRADIGIELGLDDRLDLLDAQLGDFAHGRAAFLGGDILRRHLAEGAVEHGDVAFQANLHLDVLSISLLPRRRDVGGLEGDRLVTVLLGELDPAVPVAMRDVGPAEDHQAGFQFLFVCDECHDRLILCRFRAGRGAKSLIRRGCAELVKDNLAKNVVYFQMFMYYRSSLEGEGGGRMPAG